MANRHYKETYTYAIVDKRTSQSVFAGENETGDEYAILESPYYVWEKGPTASNTRRGLFPAIAEGEFQKDDNLFGHLDVVLNFKVLTAEMEEKLNEYDSIKTGLETLKLQLNKDKRASFLDTLYEDFLIENNKLLLGSDIRTTLREFIRYLKNHLI